ncbi:MAG: ABC transporter ATP-binding protein, partial [Rhodospirillales bacterium]|nr:ABC transporter ATP-binding protein [Rhodospirillales bacterium]
MSLVISDLTVRYGTVAALSGLDLTTEPGELFVLLGGSGSGKTTLLRAIAGFVRPTAGRIALEGVDLAPLPPHRRPVNTMFQSYALFPHLSVADNVAFGLRRQGMRGAALSARVAERLAVVRLSDLAGRRPHELSGGQQQRVALARSLAPGPRLLLLDEPLSALDRGLRAETRQELMRLQRRLGTSFILVTHDQDEALGMADRIGVMRDGRLAQVGAPDAVYEHPADRFVAEFLGAANILAG